MMLYREITDEQRDDRFFREITAACFGAAAQTASVRWVVVSHIVADVVPFLEALATIGTVASVIPKQHSIDRNILERLKNSGYPIHDVGREGAVRPPYLTDLFKEKGRYIIVDIGGYFATAQLPQYAREKLLGIIECTENGHQKYERLLSTAA